MADLNHFSSLPVPTYSENPDGPGAFSALREAIAPHIILFATTEADRNSKYGSVPNGTLVSSTTTATIWKKVSGGWSIVLSDTGWISLASAAWGANAEDNSSSYRKVNDMVYVKINCTYTGSDVAVNQGGNIADIPLFTLPGDARPANTVYGLAEGTSGVALFAQIYASGGCRISYGLAGATLSGGSSIYAGFTYFASS